MRAIILLLALFLATESFAKDIHYGNGVEVYVPISERGANIYFDEPVHSFTKPSSFVIDSAEAKQLQNKTYQDLHVRWKGNKTQEKITFLLATREQVTIIFKYIQDTDVMDVFDSYSLIKGRSELSKGSSRPIALEAIALIKAMRRREFIKGYRPNNANIELKDGIEQVRTTLKGTYAGRRLIGFLLKIENNSDFEIYIDKKNIKPHTGSRGNSVYVPNDTLGPGKITHIILALDTSAKLENIHVPYYIIKGDK